MFPPPPHPPPPKKIYSSSSSSTTNGIILLTGCKDGQTKSNQYKSTLQHIGSPIYQCHSCMNRYPALWLSHLGIISWPKRLAILNVTSQCTSVFPGKHNGNISHKATTVLIHYSLIVLLFHTVCSELLRAPLINQK